jgi:uncharacterized protein
LEPQRRTEPRPSPLPQGIAEEALDRLELVITKWHPKRLTLLGDLVRFTGDPVDPLIDLFARWRNRISLPISMIGGDAEATTTIPGSWRIDDDGECRRIGRLELRHHPRPGDAASTDDATTIIAGHLHPVISLGSGSRRTLAPAFVLGRRQLILPAFAPYARMNHMRCTRSRITRCSRSTRTDRNSAALPEWSVNPSNSRPCARVSNRIEHRACWSRPSAARRRVRRRRDRSWPTGRGRSTGI